ncbi:MAG: cell envelope integrity protein TolA [Gammaproteobacteria bacterium]|jgi:colicin import membrane protein|nr:cell envelope integrity protein TolA [Gammaproteobacteria bacterium]
MWQAIRENPRAVTYAVLMHVGLLLLLVISLDWTPKAIKPGSHKPIQAELVDLSQLQAVEAKKQAEQQRIAEEQQRKLEQEAQQKAEAERKLKAEQAAKQKAEAERVAKQKAEAERKRKAEQAAKQKAEAERKRKAEQAAKEQAAKEQAAKEKAAKEKAAKEKAAKEQAEAERKRKAEQAAKEKAAAEAARQREAEQALQAQLAEEQAQARAEHALSGYIPQIQNKIQRNWLRPAGSAGGLSCLIRVKLIPGGEVVDAKVVRSSGDPLFDRSVETAVLKASPLPMPADATMFKYFREIDFNFNPDN